MLPNLDIGTELVSHQLAMDTVRIVGETRRIVGMTDQVKPDSPTQDQLGITDGFDEFVIFLWSVWMEEERKESGGEQSKIG